MENLFVESIISDLHFGAYDPNEQYKILKEQFLDRLVQLPLLDIVTIAGDVFHRKFMANSDAVSVACYFISELIDICGTKNATLIIISGTYSHDADQIKLFYPLAQQARNRGIDVRIIEEISIEFVKGKKILCIPELYNKGSEYYNQYLLGEFYDACYMHGTYMGSVYGKDNPNLDSEREPVFCMEDFNMCLGPVISGHVHQPNCFDSHFYYCGSPYRWQFGDEQQKGFIILIQDIKYHYYTVHYEEIVSDKYITIKLDDLVDKDPNYIISFINDKKERENIKFIRIIFTSYNAENMAVIKNFYNNDKYVTIVDKTKNVNIVKDMKDVEDRYKEYDYITSNSLTPEAKLVEYINNYKNSTFITVEELVNILKEL